MLPTYNECASNKEIISEILCTLTHLQSALQHYFPTVASNGYGWVILLTIDAEMRACLLTSKAPLDHICSQKQAHPSH